MSAHSFKNKRRHGDVSSYPRVTFEVGHVTFEVADHPDNGVTFALIAGEGVDAKARRPMFTGHVTRGMATQLRRLAHHIDDLEEKL